MRVSADHREGRLGLHRPSRAGVHADELRARGDVAAAAPQVTAIVLGKTRDRSIGLARLLVAEHAGLLSELLGLHSIDGHAASFGVGIGEPVASFGDALVVDGVELCGEMAEALAMGNTEFVFGSAVKHQYPLVTGSYSVHSSPEMLARVEAGIARIAGTMKLWPGEIIESVPTR